MENLKVINKMNIFDWGLIFIPPILLGITTVGLLVWQKMSGLGGALGALPLIGPIIYGWGIYIVIAFVLAVALHNKSTFRIIVGIASLPIFLTIFYELIDLLSNLTANQ